MSATISPAYLEQQQLLHQNPNYGVASLAFAPLVAQVIGKTGAKTLSDYGAGKQNLLKGLREQGIALSQYFPYDPAFPEYGPPQAADLVCCIDVLEHVEPECLEAVLQELTSITRQWGFFSVHMGPAGKHLADGRNAHLIQQPTSWWLPRLSAHFEIMQLQTHNTMGLGFWVVVRPRQTEV